MSSLKKNFIVYTASNLISTGIPFLLLPLLTAYLSLEDYGKLSNFNALITLFTPLIGLSFVAAYTRQSYKDDVDIKGYTASGINLQFIVALFFTFVLLIFEDYIVELVGVDAIYIRLVGLYCFVFSLCELVFTAWRIENKVWYFLVFRMGRTIIEVGLTLYLIMGAGFGYDGRVLGLFGATGITGVMFSWLLYRRGYLKPVFKKEHIRHALNYGVPLIPHALGGAVVAISDKLIVTDKLGLDANGVYSVAFQVGLIIGLIQNSFNQAWVPWFFERCKNITDTVKSQIVRITYLYFIALIGFTALLYFTTPLIFQILGKDFQVGSDLVIWIALGFMFNGMYKMKVNYLFYMEKTKIIGIVTIFAALINIGLNFYLIHLMGLKGAAIATCTTFFVQYIAIWIIAQRVFPMPWFNFASKK